MVAKIEHYFAIVQGIYIRTLSSKIYKLSTHSVDQVEPHFSSCFFKALAEYFKNKFWLKFLIIVTTPHSQQNYNLLVKS